MSKVLKLPQPVWMEPMLATLTDTRPRGDGWIYEPKLAGVRVLVFAQGGQIRLMSRNRKPLETAYPELADALETRVRGDAILDGEVVARPLTPVAERGRSPGTRRQPGLPWRRASGAAQLIVMSISPKITVDNI